MARMDHKDVTQNEGVHVPYNWVYASAVERAAATGFVATDVGKLAKQTDNSSLWLLTATTPTWALIGTIGITGDITINTATGAATVTDLTIASEAQGDILYRNATNWVRLAAGTSGYFLKTLGAGANPAWDAVTISNKEVRGFISGNLYTGDGIQTIPIGAAFTATTVYAQCLTAPTGDDIDIEIEYSTNQGVSWSSIATLTISATNKTGTATISQSLAANSLIRINFDTVGSTITGADLGWTVRA